MGVRSCGWIMERMEGRWPSLAPTKNSLRGEQWPFSLLPTRPQAGQGAQRAHAPGAGLPAWASRRPSGAQLARERLDLPHLLSPWASSALGRVSK